MEIFIGLTISNFLYIIILLVLAGISISQLTGNGIFEKAKLAKEKTENAQKIEDNILLNYENELHQYIGGTRNNLPSTILYPNGTESSPATISVNQRIEIENPYPGHTLYLIVQININGIWGETGYIYSGGLGYGVKATQIEGEGIDKIVIQSR